MFDIQPNLRDLEASIVAYEQEPIEKGKILFYGHSFFTRWGSPKWGYRRLDEDIRMKDGSLACVNHGFGTSTSEELLYYYDRMVRPWEPRALVLGTYANDGMYGYDVEDIMRNIGKICAWARTDFPGIKIFLMEDHPRPNGKGATIRDIWNSGKQRRERYHRLLRAYADMHEDTTVVQLWNRPEFFETPEDVGDFRKVRDDIFVDDKVHPNQEGYDIFGKIFREALDELL
jgi:lysophospholipase L1-like esterase